MARGDFQLASDSWPPCRAVETKGMMKGRSDRIKPNAKIDFLVFQEPEVGFLESQNRLHLLDTYERLNMYGVGNS